MGVSSGIVSPHRSRGEDFDHGVTIPQTIELCLLTSRSAPALNNAVSIAEIQKRRNQQQRAQDFIKVERHHVVTAIGRSTGFIKYLDTMGGKDEFARARRRGDYHVEDVPDKD